MPRPWLLEPVRGTLVVARLSRHQILIPGAAPRLLGLAVRGAFPLVLYTTFASGEEQDASPRMAALRAMRDEATDWRTFSETLARLSFGWNVEPQAATPAGSRQGRTMSGS